MILSTPAVTDLKLRSNPGGVAVASRAVPEAGRSVCMGAWRAHSACSRVVNLPAVRVFHSGRLVPCCRLTDFCADGGLLTTVGPIPAGLVEAWVGGSDWDQVTKDCSLDPGDVARLLSRTADLLRQVSGTAVQTGCSLGAVGSRTGQACCRWRVSVPAAVAAMTEEHTAVAYPGEQQSWSTHRSI